jgi:hypothetical protein
MRHPWTPRTPSRAPTDLREEPKNKVQEAMEGTFAGVLVPGTNLPVELEGYNLLLLEAHESTHVAFVDLGERGFTLSTPHYRFQPGDGAEPRAFVPALALPEIVEAIRDICDNPDYDLGLGELGADPREYERLRNWRSREELVYQVLLVDGVVTLGSSEREIARFPAEVRKAALVADRIIAARTSRGPASRADGTRACAPAPRA